MVRSRVLECITKRKGRTLIDGKKLKLSGVVYCQIQKHFFLARTKKNSHKIENPSIISWVALSIFTVEQG